MQYVRWETDATACEEGNPGRSFGAETGRKIAFVDESKN
jgi:hypothetical protein